MSASPIVVISVIAFLLACPFANAGLLGGDWSRSGSRPAHESQVYKRDAVIESAKLLIREQKWTDAENALRQHLQREPTSLQGHTLLGLVLYKQKKAKESMQEYIAAAKLGDLSSADLKIYALDCALLRDFVDADRWLTHSLELDRDNWQAWDALGHIRFEAQHYDAAIIAFKECLKIKPHTVSAESGTGLAYEAMGRTDDAVAAYRLAIQWQGGAPNKDYVPFLGLGRTLVSQNKPGEALPYAVEAVRLSPNEVSCRQLLGKTYSLVNRPGLARIELEEAVRLDPQNADVHFMLGQTYRKLGLKQQAETEFARYSALNEKK